jgi:hypothetical protein
LGADHRRGTLRFGVCMNTHAREVAAKARLQEGSRAGVERLARLAQDGMNRLRRDTARRCRSGCTPREGLVCAIEVGTLLNAFLLGALGTPAGGARALPATPCLLLRHSHDLIGDSVSLALGGIINCSNFEFGLKTRG